MRHLERLTNIAVIIGVIVFLAVVARNQFWPNTLTAGNAQVTSPQTLVGKTISLPGITYPTSRPSLILAASTSCHYCKESLPFYKNLSAAIKSKADFVAVLPQKQAEADSYVKEANLSTSKIVSADLGTIGVYATPTLLLIDSNGTVRESWIGALNEAKQRQVEDVILKGIPTKETLHKFCDHGLIG